MPRSRDFTLRRAGFPPSAAAPPDTVTGKRRLSSKARITAASLSASSAPETRSPASVIAV